jgi:site-specific recombinase XerD
MNKETKTISNLVAEISEEMARLDYKPTVLKQYHIVWDKLCAKYGERLACGFTMEFGMKFLEEAMRNHNKHLNDNSKHRWMKAIYTLSDFNRTKNLSLRREKKNFVFEEATRIAFNRYATYQESVGMSEAHRRDTKLYLERLSRYLEHVGLSDINELDSWHIHGFVNSLAIYELPTIYHSVCVLRSALKFLFNEGIIANDLAGVVPKIRYSKKAKIPSAYSKEEIEKMVLSIDRGNPRGKRDYALILLASRLGLRASDIAGLTFSSFKWDKNVIELKQQKTDKAVALPILNDIGEAVIDYIRYARPKSEDSHIFLKLNAPNDVMAANSIHHLVHMRLLDAGIHVPPGKKHGPHALRHSLASALLEDGVSLPVISEALGHSDTDTTSIYMKIDTAKLRECALEVPDFLRVYMESDRGGAR